MTLEKMSLAELLSLHGDLETQVHFNFMVDLAWFAEQRHQEGVFKILHCMVVCSLEKL